MRSASIVRPPDWDASSFDVDPVKGAAFRKTVRGRSKIDQPPIQLSDPNDGRASVRAASKVSNMQCLPPSPLPRRRRRAVSLRPVRRENRRGSTAVGFLLTEVTAVLLVLGALSAAILLDDPETKSSARRSGTAAVRELATIGEDAALFAMLTDDRCLVRDVSGAVRSAVWLKQDDRDRVHAIAGSSNGRLALGHSDGRIQMLDPETGRTLWERQPESMVPSAAEFSADGTTLAVGSDSGLILVLDTATGDVVGRLTTGAIVHTIRFMPDGKSVVATAERDSVGLWSIESGLQTARYAGGSGSVLTIDVSPKGNRLAAGTAEGSVILWDLTSGNELARRRDEIIPVLAVSFDGDGKRLILGNTIGSIRVCAVEKLHLLKELTGHPTGTRDLFVAGDRLVSGGFDGLVQTWSLTGDSSEPIRSF